MERDRYQVNGITYVYQSDFDLLILVTKNRTADSETFIDKTSRILKAERAQTPIRPIIKGVAFTNELLEKVELNVAETKQKAQENFDEWFDSANEFLTSFLSNFDR